MLDMAFAMPSCELMALNELIRPLVLFEALVRLPRLLLPVPLPSMLLRLPRLPRLPKLPSPPVRPLNCDTSEASNVTDESIIELIVDMIVETLSSCDCAFVAKSLAEAAAAFDVLLDGDALGDALGEALGEVLGFRLSELSLKSPQFTEAPSAVEALPSAVVVPS